MKKLFTLILGIAGSFGFITAQTNAMKGSQGMQTAPYKQNPTPQFNYFQAANGDTVFLFDGTLFSGNPDYVDFSASGPFDFGNYDLDGRDPNPAIANGFSSNKAFTFFFNPNAVPDTTYWIGAYSWFAPVGKADNWFTFGPIKCPEIGGKVMWQHRMPDNSFRDGYRVVISTQGYDATSGDFDIGIGTQIFSVSDNAASTNGDTIWRSRQAFIPAALAGQDIYVGFHHNADDMFILYLDEMAIVADQTANVATVNSFNMLVAPTVAKDFVQVIVGNKTRGMATIAIHDMQGKVVAQEAINMHGENNTVVMNTAHLSSGIYLVRTTINGFAKTEKIVISR